MKRKAILSGTARTNLLFFLFFAFAERAKAHCPLCTIGAGVISGIALMFGVSEMSIGVFIGAFALATGLWVSNMLRLESWRKGLLTAISFVLTVLPLTAIMSGFYPIYIHLAGDYGSPLNRTYLINLFLVGGIIGAVITYISPEISWRIAVRRGRVIRHQGVIVTIALLILISVLLHFLTINL
jgi:hypothetical protein